MHIQQNTPANRSAITGGSNRSNQKSIRLIYPHQFQLEIQLSAIQQPSVERTLTQNCSDGKKVGVKPNQQITQMAIVESGDGQNKTNKIKSLDIIRYLRRMKILPIGCMYGPSFNTSDQVTPKFEGSIVYHIYGYNDKLNPQSRIYRVEEIGLHNLSSSIAQVANNQIKNMDITKLGMKETFYITQQGHQKSINEYIEQYVQQKEWQEPKNESSLILNPQQQSQVAFQQESEKVQKQRYHQRDQDDIHKGRDDGKGSIKLIVKNGKVRLKKQSIYEETHNKKGVRLNNVDINQLDNQQIMIKIKLSLNGKIVKQLNVPKMKIVRDQVFNFYQIYYDQQLTKKVNKNVLIATKDKILYCKQLDYQNQFKQDQKPMGLDKSTIMKVSRGNMILDRHGKQQQIDTQKIEHKKISSNMEDSNLMKKSKQINKANKEVEEQINIKDDQEMDEIKKFEMNSPYRKSLFKITKKHKPFLENQIKVTQATNVKQAQEENLDISQFINESDDKYKQRVKSGKKLNGQKTKNLKLNHKYSQNRLKHEKIQIEELNQKLKRDKLQIEEEHQNETMNRDEMKSRELKLKVRKVQKLPFGKIRQMQQKLPKYQQMQCQQYQIEQCI